MVRKALIIMAAAEILSLLAFNFPVLQLPLLIIAGLASLAFSFYNLESGVYLLFGELFIGSRGHLLEYNFGFAVVSLRLIIFGAVFVVWLIKTIRNRSLALSEIGEGRVRYGLLLAAVAMGIVVGLIHHNTLANVFNDANAYLYLLILPAVLSVIKTRAQVEKILEILAAAVIIIAVKTLGLFIWFSFDLPGVATAYHWIINQDFGEITGNVGRASRIFMQSQFYSLMGLFVFIFYNPLSPPYIKGEEGRIQVPPLKIRGGREGLLRWLTISCAILSVIMSLSRSFWLGAIAGGIFALVMLLYLRTDFKKILFLTGKLALVGLVEIVLLFGLVKLAGGGFADAVSSRGSNPATEAAGGARLLLLPELLNSIKRSPLIGQGFGKLVSYKSFLPDRITKDNPDGTITNFAFEWGYLDIALKIGALGLLVYLFFIAGIFKLGLLNIEYRMLNIGMLSGLAALLVLNNTTPYLNHPLGIGYLILLYSTFNIPNSAS